MATSRTLTLSLLITGALGARAATLPAQQVTAAAKVTPSVVWCDDFSTVRFEVTIRNRTDVAQVEISDLNTGGILIDDGTNGDLIAGDNVFTGFGGDVFCGSAGLDASADGVTARTILGGLRLNNGSLLENVVSAVIGEVSRSLKGAFPVTDLGDGLLLSRHAFFIQDTRREVFPGYPFSDVFNPNRNIAAARKLYSVLPDVFDILIVTPGLAMFDPTALTERTPFLVPVSNQVRNIGRTIDDGTYAASFGSAGRLKGAMWQSFAAISVADHEVAHTWGASIGRSLGIADDGGHWNALSDVGGQLGNFYRKSDGRLGHFAYNGDNTWRWVPNTVNPPYAPLELYIMGLIDASEVPPVHLLTSPDTTDLNRITAASVRTITIQEIMQAEGGPRNPGPETSQKAFNVGYVVVQEDAFTDAQIAFSSQLSKLLMSLDPPHGIRASFFAPFHWATGGRATLSTDMAAAAGSVCGYTRSASTAAFGSRGGIGSVGVTGASHCAWTAVTNVDSQTWITVLRPTGRSQGPGNVVYAVKANTGTTARTGTLTIAGRAFTVTQQPAGTGQNK